MRKSKILALSAALSAALLAALPAAQAAETAPGTLTVTGVGEYKAAPDEAVLSFQITSLEKSAAKARAKTEETVAQFLNELKALHLPEGAVVAENLSVTARFNYTEGRSELTGFQAARQVRVTLDDFAKIGEVTDLAFKSGINEAAGFAYKLKNPQAAEREARALAIADAKAKAQELADGFGVKLGRPQSLSFNSAPSVSPRPLMLMSARSDAAGNGAVYTADDLTVSAAVSAVYTFE